MPDDNNQPPESPESESIQSEQPEGEKRPTAPSSHRYDKALKAVLAVAILAAGFGLGKVGELAMVGQVIGTSEEGEDQSWIYSPQDNTPIAYLDALCGEHNFTEAWLKKFDGERSGIYANADTNERKEPAGQTKCEDVTALWIKHTTCGDNYSGTDDAIYITLNGQVDSETNLDNDDWDDREKGKVDEYEITDDLMAILPLKQITLSIDDTDGWKFCKLEYAYQYGIGKKNHIWKAVNFGKESGYWLDSGKNACSGGSSNCNHKHTFKVSDGGCGNTTGAGDGANAQERTAEGGMGLKELIAGFCYDWRKEYSDLKDVYCGSENANADDCREAVDSWGDGQEELAGGASCTGYYAPKQYADAIAKAKTDSEKACSTSVETATVDTIAKAKTDSEKASSTSVEYALRDNGDGTITDPNLGLTWMKCPQGYSYDTGSKQCQEVGTKTFKYCSRADSSCNGNDHHGVLDSGPAFESCNTLNYADHTDWRVPTIDELRSLVKCTDGKTPKDYGSCGEGNYTSPAIDTSVFPSNFPGTRVWSSSSGASFSSDAWFVYFNYGHVTGNYKFRNYAVVCVR